MLVSLLYRKGLPHPKTSLVVTQWSHCCLVACGGIGFPFSTNHPCRKIQQFKSSLDNSNGSWQWGQSTQNTVDVIWDTYAGLLDLTSSVSISIVCCVDPVDAYRVSSVTWNGCKVRGQSIWSKNSKCFIIPWCRLPWQISYPLTNLTPSASKTTTPFSGKTEKHGKPL